MLFINPDECIDCAACEPVCPVMAIFADACVPPADREFNDLNARYFRDRAAARARVNVLAAAKDQAQV
jgi:Fe-S-cluster-containing hydrogenase component 2